MDGGWESGEQEFSNYFLVNQLLKCPSSADKHVKLIFFQIEKYQGTRTESDLKSYVNKMLGMKETKSEEESEGGGGGMVTLNSENFQSGIAQGLSFVKFFAPWCGHCKRLAPIWNELNKKIEGVSNVRLAKVDCTQENSKELCNEQEVSFSENSFTVGSK